MEKKFYPVIYLNNGDACVGSPCATEEECIEELKRAIRENPTKVKATTYMVREQEDCMALFGHPKSRDMMQDKKFLKTL